MNKKWIEFVEKHTNWIWLEQFNGFYFVIENIGQAEHGWWIKAKPEDLLGHQIEFADKCGYNIEVIKLYRSFTYEADNKKNYTVEYKYAVREQNSSFICCEGIEKNHFEAFDTAWNKFLELIED